MQVRLPHIILPVAWPPYGFGTITLPVQLNKAVFGSHYPRVTKGAFGGIQTDRSQREFLASRDNIQEAMHQRYDLMDLVSGTCRHTF